MSHRAAVVVFAAFLSLCPSAAHASQDNNARDITVENLWPQVVGMNGTVTFVVRSIKGLPADGEDSPKKLVLFVNGVPLADAFPDYVDLRNERVRFTLRVSDLSRPQWASVAGILPRPVALSVGWPKGGAAPLQNGAPKTVRLEPSLFRELLSLVLAIGVLVATLVLAVRSNFLRDRARDPKATGTFTFSLARSQMAWWLVVTAVSFLYIWALTGAWTFTAQALILIGISATTGAGAVLIDASKQENATHKRAALQSEKVQLAREIASVEAAVSSAVRAGAVPPAVEPLVKGSNADRLNVIDAEVNAAQRQAAPPTSTSSYFKDILSDAGGVSLYRFQHVIWTVILGIMFLHAVVATLQMPTFDDKLLWLLGISGGTYIGFKFPEQK